MRKIKDPYFEIFSRGGNVEKSISADPKANGETKKKLIQLAKDEADIKFDLELEIIKQLEDKISKTTNDAEISRLQKRVNDLRDKMAGHKIGDRPSPGEQEGFEGFKSE